MAIFKGAGVAIVTPMYDDGKVNYDKLEELLEAIETYYRIVFLGEGFEEEE